MQVSNLGSFEIVGSQGLQIITKMLENSGPAFNRDVTERPIGGRPQNARNLSLRGCVLAIFLGLSCLSCLCQSSGTLEQQKQFVK